MRNYLAGEEVPDLMFGYFDYEKELEYMKKEEREEALAEGEAKGRDERSQEIYQRLISGNMPPEKARQIAFG